MESIVLTDGERLQLAGPFCTFKVEDGKFRWSESPAFKFIVLNTGELVIGPINDHRKLLTVYRAWHLRPREFQESIFTFSDPPKGVVTGAGNVSSHGRIMSWHSIGFGIATPLEERPSISHEIERLYKRGELDLGLTVLADAS